MKNLNIVAIIPARKGSKGIKDKNIVKLKNITLLGHSILAAKKSNIKKIIISSDSKKYIKIAKKYGIEAPFIRPKKYSKDNSLDEDYLRHCYNWYYKNKKFKIDIFVILRPTTPFRDPKIIKKALKIFISKKLNYLRSAHEAPESPFKWFKQDKKGFYKPITKNSNLKMTFMGRQNFEEVYVPNGYIDILKTSLISKKNIYGNKMYVFNTKKSLEIDNIDDLNFAKKY